MSQKLFKFFRSGSLGMISCSLKKMMIKVYFILRVFRSIGPLSVLYDDLAI